MIHVVIGTKAQLIKMAPLLVSFDEIGAPYNFILTGQHEQTMEDLLNDFGLAGPDKVLYEGPDITSVAQMFIWSIKILWRVIWNKEEIFRGDEKGLVLVHGDTFSTLLGALMAKFGGHAVGHVESGLRSYNLLNPFPEELIRLATFMLSDLMFCPDVKSVNNLKNHKGTIVNTGGNTLYDALKMVLRKRTVKSEGLIPEEPYAVITLHRFENIRSKKALERIIDCVERVATCHRCLFILHKPTKQRLKSFGLYKHLGKNKNIEFRPRYDYTTFIKLVQNARFVVSDGGSNQEECYYIGKPILLLREATERDEGLGENCVLSRYAPERIQAFLDNIEKYSREPVVIDQSPCSVIAKTCLAYQP